MTIVLYDLCGRDDRRFSPHCWRSRMAIAHKGLDCEAQPTRFIDIAGIAGGGQRIVPVIDDNGTLIADSTSIANYLEETYPDRASLFGGNAGRALTGFVQHWVNLTLQPALIRLLVHDIYQHLQPEDQSYFRDSRERRFGQSLEQVQAGREQRLAGFRDLLRPLRSTLKRQAFLGGDAPLYADYLVFGAFQWARVISPLRLLAEEDDPIKGWFERCLDLYDGLGRSTPGYDG